MGDLHPAQLHKLMRTWLLSEDPYGMNQRQEPTMGNDYQVTNPNRASRIGENAVADALAPPSDPTRARNQGEKAVREALDVSGRVTPQPGDPPELVNRLTGKSRASEAGAAAVDKAINAPNVNSEAFQGERNPRAQAWGTEAVGEATAKPAPLPMNAPGWASPEEAQAWASGVGQSAVERALATKSRARGKLQPSLPSEEE